MDIDLNVSNYSIDDLKRFFNVNPAVKVDEVLLNQKMMELQDRIIISENVTNEFKRNFNHFLNDATNILLKSLHAEDAMQERKLDNVEFNPTHPIVHIPKDPFIYTQSSEAFQGVVNPLERRIVTKVLSIDSEFRKPLHNKLHNPIEQITDSNNFMSKTSQKTFKDDTKIKLQTQDCFGINKKKNFFLSCVLNKKKYCYWPNFFFLGHYFF